MKSDLFLSSIKIDVPFLGYSSWVEFGKSVFDTFENSQKEAELSNNRPVDCHKGCSSCCSHWVEDVYFFEGLAIWDYLNEHCSHKIDDIVEQSIRSEQMIEDLYDSQTTVDEIELLQQFYTLKIPCPLLSEEGTCTIYPVRPITCRSFFSENNVRFCFDPKPNDIEGTYMISCSEDLAEFLDDVHIKYGKEYPTSLRSLLFFLDKKNKKV